MLLYGFVLFYKHVENKYASLLLIYARSSRTKTHNNLRAHSCKGNMRFKRLMVLCPILIHAISQSLQFTLAVWPQSNIHLPAVIKSSVQRIRLHHSSVLTALLDHELFYFQFCLLFFLNFSASPYTCLTLISVSLSRYLSELPLRSGTPFKSSKALQEQALENKQNKTTPHHTHTHTQTRK